MNPIILYWFCHTVLDSQIPCVICVGEKIVLMRVFGLITEVFFVLFLILLLNNLLKFRFVSLVLIKEKLLPAALRSC